MAEPAALLLGAARLAVARSAAARSAAARSAAARSAAARSAAARSAAARRRRILAVAFATIFLAACQSPSTVTFHGSTIQFITWDRGSSREAALLGGRLTLEDGCLFEELDGSRYLLIWPRGWDAVEQDGTLVIRGDGRELRLGDDLRLAGGDHDRAFVETIAGRPIPVVCRTDEYAVVAGW